MSGNEYVTLDLLSLGTYSAVSRTEVSPVDTIILSEVKMDDRDLASPLPSPDLPTLSEVRMDDRDLAQQLPNIDTLGFSELNLTNLTDPRIVPISVPVASLATYRLRGYYVAGSAYEFWTGSSLLTPNPSGNPLTNVVLDCILEQ